MNTRDLALIGVLLIVIAGIVVAGFMFQSKDGTLLPAATPQGEDSELPLPDVIPAFTPEIPKDAVLTTPSVDIPPDPGDTKRQGIFSVQATRDGYSPHTLTVGQGNIVTLQFSSADAQYDMYSESFGFYVTAPKGETKEISFKAGTVGSFLFECRDFCPGGKKIQGQLIVIP